MATWTPQTKNSTTFANVSKSASTFSNEAKTLTYSNLLLESGSALLLEIGDNILLELTGGATSWNNLAKN